MFFPAILATASIAVALSIGAPPSWTSPPGSQAYASRSRGCLSALAAILIVLGRLAQEKAVSKPTRNLKIDHRATKLQRRWEEKERTMLAALIEAKKITLETADATGMHRPALICQIDAAIAKASAE
jgi:hypothetical protein